MPDFSATKTRPSGENRVRVGFVSPLQTTSSVNPANGVDSGSTSTDPAPDPVLTGTRAVTVLQPVDRKRCTQDWGGFASGGSGWLPEGSSRLTTTAITATIDAATYAHSPW